MVRETVVFAAGSRTESVRVRTADRCRGESIDVVALSRGFDQVDDA